MKKINMKIRLLSCLLAIVMLIGMALPAAAASVPFKDVPSSSWYAPAVEYCYTEGLMSGLSSTTFAPGQSVTRAMMVQVLYNMDGVTVTDSQVDNQPFKDVPASQWYAKAVTWGYTVGVTSGTSATAFSPTTSITREQVATMFYNYYRMTHTSMDTTATQVSKFSDYSKISSWAKEPMAWAVNSGMLSGVGNNKLDPKGTATRAQLAQILMNYNTRIATPGATPTPAPKPTATPVPTATPKPEKDEYTYDVYFIDDLGTTIYSGGNKVLYIKTDNPDPMTIDFFANGKRCPYVSSKYDDVEYLNTSIVYNGLYEVSGGYLRILRIDQPGKTTLEVKEVLETDEFYRATYATVGSYQLNVLDSDAIDNQWMDDVISSVTTSKMNPLEKMEAVASYLKKDAGFRYSDVLYVKYVYLAAKGSSPVSVSKQWNSYVSPAYLAAFAERIGGFEKIHNCYGDYPIGSAMWQIVHANVNVTYKGETKAFSCCPSITTGEIGEISMIDFSDVSRFSKLR